MNQLNETDYGTPARASEQMVTLEIDGVAVTVPAGTSVMRAAVEAGINVPKLCATDSLEPFGSCRLCLVEIEGPRLSGLLHHALRAGHEGAHADPKLAELRGRDGALHLRPPAGLPDLPANGNCELQDMAGVVGLREVRYGYEGANHPDEEGRIQSLLHLRPVQVHRLQPLRARLRGNAGHLCADHQRPRLRVARVGRAEEAFMESECVSCGACVQACPTATLRKRPSSAGPGRAQRGHHLRLLRRGLLLQGRDEGQEVVRMVPYKDGKANQGHSCVKGRFAWGYATHKDRILKPMIRKSINDPWREVSWEEALSYAASEFRRIQAKHGKDSIGGITSSRCTNEETYLVQKLVRAAFGNNNVDTCARVCHSPTGYGLKQTLGESAGTQTFESVMKADVIMVIGANPTDGHPVFASQIKRRVRQGAKLIVIDPRHRPGQVAAPEGRLSPEAAPGTNVAIITALAHVIVTEGLLNEPTSRALRPQSFKHWRSSSCAENSPEAMAAITGVPAETCAARRACMPPAATRRSTTAWA
jgi:formate dehydrogenase major subunit